MNLYILENLLNKQAHFAYGRKHIIYYVYAVVIYRKVHGMYISPTDMYRILKQNCESTF